MMDAHYSISAFFLLCARVTHNGMRALIILT